ncbi:MAG: nitrilase-related carbon-nitrogen hydrolase [Gemmatimonadota bacterium]
MPERALRLAVLQTDARPRDVTGNLDRLAAMATATGAELTLTPELSVTGYGVSDDAATLAVPLRTGAGAPPSGAAASAAPGTLVLGAIERGVDGLPYNVAAALADGAVGAVQRKIYLPTYGTFDEGRFFARGRTVTPWTLTGGWRAGVLVCEDLWHPGLAYALAAQDIHLLLVLSAAPGRGAWEGSAAGGLFASAEPWEHLARAAAHAYGVYVALANRCGVEGGVTFAGGSLVVAPDGALLARAPELEQAALEVELDPAALRAARRPWSHFRDDDPALVRRALEALP